MKVITNPNGADLCAWLIPHGLSISDTKNELLIVSPHYQLSKISIDSITFGDSTIQPVGSVHNLGLVWSQNGHVCPYCQGLL